MVRPSLKLSVKGITIVIISSVTGVTVVQHEGTRIVSFAMHVELNNTTTGPPCSYVFLLQIDHVFNKVEAMCIQDLVRGLALRMEQARGAVENPTQNKRKAAAVPMEFHPRMHPGLIYKYIYCDSLCESQYELPTLSMNRIE